MLVGAGWCWLVLVGAGLVLVWCWFGAGLVLVWCWFGAGLVLVGIVLVGAGAGWYCAGWCWCVLVGASLKRLLGDSNLKPSLINVLACKQGELICT